MVLPNLFNGMVVGTTLGYLTHLAEDNLVPLNENKEESLQYVNGIALTILGVLGGQFAGLDALKSAQLTFTTLGTAHLIPATIAGDAFFQEVPSSGKFKPIFTHELDFTPQINKIQFLLTKLGIFGTIVSILGRNAGMVYLGQSAWDLGCTEKDFKVPLENMARTYQTTFLPMVTGSILTYLAIATTSSTLPVYLKVYGVSLGILVLGDLFSQTKSGLRHDRRTWENNCPIPQKVALGAIAGCVFGLMASVPTSNQLHSLNIKPIIGSVLSAAFFPILMQIISEFPSYTSSCYTKGIEGDNNWEKIQNYFKNFSHWVECADKTDEQLRLSKIVHIAMSISLIILTRNSLKSFIRQSV